jgi:hypothetical protein
MDEWKLVSIELPNNKDWVQVLVIRQEYINLGITITGIAGQSQSLKIAMFHPEHDFCIDGITDNKITHWCYPPSFPNIVENFSTIEIPETISYIINS